MVDLSTGGYATVTQLTTWLGTAAPDNAVSLLRSATFVIAHAAERNPYADSPSDTDAQPLADATCAQVESWIALGIDPAALGINPGSAPVKKSSILGADVERDTSAQAEAILCAAREICTQAADILHAAGLLWVPVPVFDDSGWLPSWGLDDRRWGLYPGGYFEHDRWLFT